MVEFQCAVAARDRAEPMFATASQVRRWLLIEVRGAWGRDAVVDSDLARYAASGWQRRLQDAQVRVIAIRRDLDRSSEEALHLYYVDADRGRTWGHRVATLHQAIKASADVPLGEAGSRWQPHPDPLVLVCTNGRHDPCCATFGRPLARLLRQGPGRDAIWECSHIGGDRFAANIVILPEGLYFGRCDGDAAQRLIDDYHRGAILLDNYRGRSTFAFYDQAAEFFVRRELGVTSITGIPSIRRIDGTPGQFEVDIDDEGVTRTVDVHVARASTTAVTPLTCTGPNGQRLPTYELVSINARA
ncbi:MAG: Sucraseferredoxin family protein [Desertimonas sp.]|nr:Sucraseferredoxin family protein [Desertimonas sp.]